MESLDEQIRKLLSLELCDQSTAQKFLEKTLEGKLTRDENPESHFCVYFGAIDIFSKKVLIGHHKKSGLWLFNGGHIDETENIETALNREIQEEWGLKMKTNEMGNPQLLSITEIDNASKQPCKIHFDIWYLISVSNNNFHPDRNKLEIEFHETKWVNLDQAKKLVTDANTLHALKIIKKKFK